MASGQWLSIFKQANVSFQIGPHYFRDSFLILPTINSAILGNPFFKKTQFYYRSEEQFVTNTGFNFSVESYYVVLHVKNS